MQQPRCGDPNTTTTMVLSNQNPPQIHRKSNAENGCFLALWAVFWPCGQIFWRRKWCTSDRSGPSSAVCEVCIGAQCRLYWARASAWGQFRHMSQRRSPSDVVTWPHVVTSLDHWTNQSIGALSFSSSIVLCASASTLLRLAFRLPSR